MPSLSRIRFVSGLVACLLAQSSAFAQTAPADNSQLKFALVFSRHGVRPPTKTNDTYQPYAVDTWPSWSVSPGYLTVHGAQLMTLMGTYYSAYFVQQGLLRGSGSNDVDHVYFYADNAERTYATGQALAAGMFPGTPPPVNEFLPTTASDPLFYPVKAMISPLDYVQASSALAGRIGADASALSTANQLQFALLESALLNQPITADPTVAPKGITDVATMPLTVTTGSGTTLVGFSGSVDTASTLTEIFLLEYADGKDPQDIAWGRLTKQQIQQVTQLHTLDFNLTDRTPYMAQVQASNLLLHIRNTLLQAATGVAIPQAIGPAGTSIVMLTGHDDQLASLGGLMNIDWQPPTFAWDDTPPGGAFRFELRLNAQGEYVVRLAFVSQTIDQMHDATTLTLQNGPSVIPIFVPGVSQNTPYFDMPLGAFSTTVDKLVALRYTN